MSDHLVAAIRAGTAVLDLGLATVRIRSDLPAFWEDFLALYRDYPLAADADFADVAVRIERPSGLRRWFRPQAVFGVDAQRPFDPFPADTALPLFEWGVNWCLGNLINHHLLIHAGAVEASGKGVLLAATPGSGKSTLTVALAESGFRYLSDEFGALSLDDHQLRALLKPAALKNKSIPVIRDFAPAARLGRSYPKTRKGEVAHYVPSLDSIVRRREAVPVRLLVFPRYEAGAALRVTEVLPSRAFLRLGFNSFNYSLLGPAGFRTVSRVVAASRAVELTYSNFPEAIAAIRELLDQPP